MNSFFVLLVFCIGIEVTYYLILIHCLVLVKKILF